MTFLKGTGVFIFLVVSCVWSATSKIEVKDTGIKPMKKGDMALIFYISVTNSGSGPVDLWTKMHKCCLHDSTAENKTDCESMHLIGGHHGELLPHDYRNLTLMYPNLYLTDRSGQCEVDIFDKEELLTRHKIEFNTAVPSKSSWIPVFIKDYVYGSDYMDCNTMDQDRLHHCAPVDCVVKYNGLRNHFNKETNLCEPVPDCSSDSSTETPNKAYNRQFNSCKNLELTLQEEDLKGLTKGKTKSYIEKLDYLSIKQYECNHGHLKPDKNRCECEAGWGSEEDESQFNPYTGVYHMCNIEVPSEKKGMQLDGLVIAMIVIGAVCMFLLIFVVSMCMFMRYKAEGYRVRPKTSLEKLAQSLGTSQSKASTVKKSKHGHKASGEHSINESNSNVEFLCAQAIRVNTALAEDELELQIGDFITDLKPTEIPGLWHGSRGRNRGVFPARCVEFFDTIPEITDSESD